MRAFGSRSETQTVQNLLTQRLFKMRQRLEATLRYHRFGAVTGKIYDADGSRVLICTSALVSPHSRSTWRWLPKPTDLQQKNPVTPKRKSEDVIGDSGVITGWLSAWPELYDAPVATPQIKQAYDRWNDGQFLRDDLRKGSPLAR